MKKNIMIAFVFLIICCIICIGINRLMIKNIENIKTDFFDVVSGNKSNDIDYGALLRYDYTNCFEIKTIDDMDLKIDFVLHNFRKGYMLIRYSFDINKEYKNTGAGVGAYNVNSKWYVKKQKGRWIVYSIFEEP